MFEHVDLYCERTGSELWSEPVNALTNIAFILAGWWGLREARRNGADLTVIVLCWWVVAIGVGSSLFHTFANRLTMLADVVPIAIFTLAYTGFVIRRYLGFSWLATAAIFAGFYLGAGFLTRQVPIWMNEATNGSMGYLPAFLALFVFGSWVAARGHPAGRWIVAGAFTFLVSVIFRALDHEVCHVLPIGTHFMWHILNAVMLGLLLIAAARHGATGERQEKTAGTSPAVQKGLS
jgi:hypothetical protein